MLNIDLISCIVNWSKEKIRANPLITGMLVNEKVKELDPDYEESGKFAVYDDDLDYVTSLTRKGAIAFLESFHLLRTSS